MSRGRRRSGSSARQSALADSTWPRKRVNVTFPTVRTPGSTSMMDATVHMPGKTNSVKVGGFTTATTASSGATALGQTLNLTGKNLLLWWYVDDSTANTLQITGGGLQVSSDGTNFVSVGGSTGIPFGPDKHVRDYGRWMPVEVPCEGAVAPLGSASVLGMPLYGVNGLVNWSAITHIKVTATASARGTGSTALANVWLGAIEIIDRPREPVVSFVFDRFNANNFLEARPILSAKGWAGTFRGQIGQLFDGNPNFMTLTQAKTAYGEGWDIGVYDYPATGFIDGSYNFGTAATAPFSSRAKATALSDLQLAQKYLIDNSMPRGGDQLAGQARKLYLDGYTDVTLPLFNTVDIPQNAEFPAFWPPADPMSLPHKMYIRSVDDNDGLGTANQARIKQTIDRAIGNHEWLIMLFHDVGTAPTPDGFTISAVKFQELVDYISAAGTKVRTVSQVMHGQV